MKNPWFLSITLFLLSGAGLSPAGGTIEPTPESTPTHNAGTVILQRVSMDDLQVCRHLRASLSPDGQVALFDYPLMRNRYSPWIGEPHRRSILRGDVAPAPMLVDLDCLLNQQSPLPTRACAALADVGASSPWSEPSWSSDSGHVALLSATGRLVADRMGRLNVVGGLHDYLSGAERYTSFSTLASARMSLPATFQPVDERGYREELSSTRTSITSDDLIVLSTQFTPIQSVRVDEAALLVRVGSTGREISFAPGRFSNTIRVVDGGRGIRISTDRAQPPHSITVDLSTGETTSADEWPQDMFVRPIATNDGSGVFGYYSDHEARPSASASDAANNLFERINTYLGSKPEFDLYDISVDAAGQRAIVSLQHQFVGREFALISADHERVLRIGLECDHEGGYGHYTKDWLLYATRLGNVPVTLFRQQEVSNHGATDGGPQPRRAVIWMRGSPLAYSSFGLPEIWAQAQLAGMDVFSVDYVGSSGRGLDLESPQAHGGAWDWAISQCVDVLNAVRTDFANEYDEIGIMGERVGGLIALASLLDTGCEPDFSIVQNPVLNDQRGARYPVGYSTPTGVGEDIWMSRMHDVERLVSATPVRASSEGLLVLDFSYPWADMEPASRMLDRLASDGSAVVFDLRGRGTTPLTPAVRAANTRLRVDRYIRGR